jgi:hypothetical protein
MLKSDSPQHEPILRAPRILFRNKFTFVLHIFMEFKVGDLVWIASAFEGTSFHSEPAVIVSVYVDLPRVFLYNKEANAKWLEAEDIGVGIVYDILYNGHIEEAVLGEWLVAFEPES